MLDLAYHLCPEKRPAHEQERRALLWSGQIAAVVGRDLVARDTGSPDGGEPYLERLLPRLERLLASALPTGERAEAGRVLGRLGDPRPEVISVDEMEFCWIPEGPFRMGSDKTRDRDADDDEEPAHQLSLPAFFIGRHPVTNAHFRVFVDEGGYGRKEFWGEAIQADVWQDGQIKGRWDEEARGGPQDFERAVQFAEPPGSRGHLV